MISHLIRNINFKLGSKRLFSLGGIRHCKSSSSDLDQDWKLTVEKNFEKKDEYTLEDFHSRDVLRNSLINLDDSLDVSSVSGVPEGQFDTRRARIFMPAKNAMQSATNDTHHWLIEFDTQQRWENPLMGWSSSGDCVSNLSIRFSTKEDAIDFCNKSNWTYFVDEPVPPRKPKFKSYADNFSWNRRTRVGSK